MYGEGSLIAPAFLMPFKPVGFRMRKTGSPVSEKIPLLGSS
jgi:hypothetical protein